MKKLSPLALILLASQLLTHTSAQTAAHSPELYVQTGHNSLLYKIVLSPTGKFAASMDWTDRNFVKIWSVRDGKELTTLRQDDYVGDLVFSPDEKFIFTTTFFGDAEIRKWSVETGREVDGLKCNGTTVELSPDTRLALCRSFTASGPVNALWDVSTKRIMWSVSAGAKGGSSRLSPDWTRFFFQAEDSLRVIDINSGKEISKVSGADVSYSILDNGAWLLLFVAPGKRALWNTDTGEMRDVSQSGIEEYDVRTDASGKNILFVDDDKNVAEALTVDDLTRRVKINLASRSAVCSIDFADDRESLLVVETGGVIRKLSLASGKEMDRLDTGGDIQYGSVPSYGLRGLKGYSPECHVQQYSHMVTFARPNSWISVWDWGRRREVTTFGGFSRRQNVVAFSPDGAFLASGGASDGAITLFPLAGNSAVKYLTGHENVIYSIAYSADGTRLASADIGGVIKVWDVKTGEELQQFNANRWVWDVAFSPDGKLVASADEGGFIKVWRVNEKGEQKSFRAGLPLTFKASYTLATAVAFGPGGDTLAIADVNGECDLWSATTGKHIRSFARGVNAMLDAVAFSRDGTTVVAASKTGMTRTDRYPSVALGPGLVRDNRGETRVVVRRLHGDSPTLWFPDKGDQPEAAEDAKDSPKERKGRDDFIFVWETATGKLLRRVERRGVKTLANIDVIPLSFSDNGPTTVIPTGPPKEGDKDEFRFVPDKVVISRSLSEDGVRYDLEAMREMWPTAPALYRNVSPDGRFVVNRSVSGILELFNLQTGKRLCSLVPLVENKWAVVTSEGRFDANELDNPRGLHWFVRDVSLRPLSFEVFMRDYFEPRLLPRLLGCTAEGDCGSEFKAVRDLSSLNYTQPRIKITNVAPVAAEPGTVEVSVEGEDVASAYQRDSRGRVLSSGVYDLRLFRNGQLVGNSTPDAKLQSTFRAYGSFTEELSAWREANKVDLTNGKKAFTFRVKLPKVSAGGRVEFSAYAFNDDRVKSETARVEYSIPADAALKPEPRKAYVIAFGVNRYDNPAWDLQYAADDARSMSEVVSARLRRRKEFSEVIEIPLIADVTTTPSGETAVRRGATKSNVKSVLELLGGKTPTPRQLTALANAVGAETVKKISEAKPDDMVLLSFSSHGYADRNGVFYILPADIGRKGGETVTGELLRRAISSDELSLWLRDVDAGELVMIVDACYAASAVEGEDFKPAPMGSRGLGQLAFDKGMKILAATQAANVAIETGGSIGHGLLTFALVREGLELDKADFRAADKVIGLKEWLEYGEYRVPGLYDDLSNGRLKSVGKARAELIGVGARDSKSSTQQPSLFDFTRVDSGIVLAQLP